MHLNILNKSQSQLLSLVADFKSEFYLVGGTAIGFHIGHRFSIDFDLFKKGTIRHKAIINKFEKKNEFISVIFKDADQLHLNCRDVKFTFFNYEFDIPHPLFIEKFISVPSLLDLAAMKAYALGRRSKWKDYVDLFFILKDHFTIIEITNRALDIYGDLFSEKLFRGQLSYFSGINYSEEVEYLPGFELPENTIKQFLTEAALTEF